MWVAAAIVLIIAASVSMWKRKYAMTIPLFMVAALATAVATAASSLGTVSSIVGVTIVAVLLCFGVVGARRHDRNSETVNSR